MQASDVARADPPVTRIRMLGPFAMERAGVPIPPLESARAESVLAYLLLHPGTSVPRARLAAELWPESAEAQARTNLRHVLHTLRHALPGTDRLLAVTPRTLAWRDDAPCRVDVREFDGLLDLAARAPGEERELLARALRLYGGELLEGRYDEWLAPHRERLRLRHLDALERLARSCADAGDHAAAAEHADRLLRAEPLHEDACRLLMTAYDALGQRPRALRAYHTCAAALERELGVRPAPETREVYEGLLPHGRVPVRAAHVAAPEPPFVGRTAERRRLVACWRTVSSGSARVVLVTGEPGVGKTRLVEEFSRWCGRHRAAVAAARSYAGEGPLAFAPLVTWLRTPALRARIDRLGAAHRAELTRLLPELAAGLPPGATPQPLPEAERRRRLFEAVGAAVQAAGPLVLVADDVHWSDTATVQLVHYLVREHRQSPLLVAATARDEEAADHDGVRELVRGLRALGLLEHVALGRLSREEAAVLATRLAAEPLDDAELDRLTEETDGNPLFVVESVRAGRRGGPPPERVQEVIGDRLARLPDGARELVGVAAAVGGSFTAELLADASGSPEEDVVRDLDELWRRGIVREHGTAAYDFTHGHVRDVAYAAVPPARRRRHHRRIGDALARAHADDAEAVAGVVAEHLERAGLPDTAVDWYERAARAAQLLHANAEAARLLERALAIVATRPPSPARDRRELALLSALPAPYGAIDGYSSPRLATVHERALALVRITGSDPAPPLLRSLAIEALTRSDFAAARGHGAALLARGERERDGVLVVEGAYTLGVAAFWQADFAAAREHFELAIARYDPAHRAAHLLHYAQDPRIVCLSRLANTQLFLGDPAQAQRTRDAAVILADAEGDPYSRSVAHLFAAVLAIDTGDVAALRRHTAAVAALAHGARQVATVVPAFQGRLAIEDGDAAHGLALVDEAVAAARDAPPAPGFRAMLTRIRLAALLAAGEHAAAARAAEELLAMGGAARVWEAEARRVLDRLVAPPG